MTGTGNFISATTPLMPRSINVDMDVQACTEALAGLSAYYRASPTPQ